MSNLQKLQSLYKLYQYRALGFSYAKTLNLNAQKSPSPKNSLETVNSLSKSCHLCDLAKTRKNMVFGEGNENANIMFIGESPSISEDQTGRPFMGRSGQMLTAIISNVLNLTKDDVYITNIIKCRTPNNRPPTREEISTCRAFMDEQIQNIKPKIIVCLGELSYHCLTKEYDTNISQIRGEIFEYGEAKLIPTYHPNFILRNPSLKRDLYNDMLKVKEMLK